MTKFVSQCKITANLTQLLILKAAHLSQIENLDLSQVSLELSTMIDIKTKDWDIPQWRV